MEPSTPPSVESSPSNRAGLSRLIGQNADAKRWDTALRRIPPHGTDRCIGSVPIPFVEPPSTAFRLPPGRHPNGAGVRRHRPATGGPLVVIGFPRPIPGNPDMIGRRPRRRHVLLRDRRCLHHDDRTSAGRRRHGGHGGRRCRRGNRRGVNRGRGRGGRRRRRRSGNDVRLRLRSATSEQADYAANCDGTRKRTRTPNLIRDRDCAFHTRPADSGIAAWFAARPIPAMGCPPHGPTPLNDDRARQTEPMNGVDGHSTTAMDPIRRSQAKSRRDPSLDSG